MADTLSKKKPLPSTAQFFVGLAFAIWALIFPVVFLVTLAICTAIALTGKRLARKPRPLHLEC
jgi:hypothetical protein